MFRCSKFCGALQTLPMRCAVYSGDGLLVFEVVDDYCTAEWQVGKVGIEIAGVRSDDQAQEREPEL